MEYSTTTDVDAAAEVVFVASQRRDRGLRSVHMREGWRA